jgi:hypothetical protein
LGLAKDNVGVGLQPALLGHRPHCNELVAKLLNAAGNLPFHAFAQPHNCNYRHYANHHAQHGKQAAPLGRTHSRNSHTQITAHKRTHDLFLPCLVLRLAGFLAGFFLDLATLSPPGTNTERIPGWAQSVALTPGCITQSTVFANDPTGAYNAEIRRALRGFGALVRKLEENAVTEA